MWSMEATNIISRTGKIPVPASEGRAVTVRAGQHVRVVDIEGGQVGDVFAFAADDPGEYLSASHTRTHTSRLFPHVGEAFVTNRRRPILTLAADTSPGAHDMLIAACDPERYLALGADAEHASCAENLRTALSQLGLRTDVDPSAGQRVHAHPRRCERGPALAGRGQPGRRRHHLRCRDGLRRRGLGLPSGPQRDQR